MIISTSRTALTHPSNSALATILLPSKVFAATITDLGSKMYWMYVIVKGIRSVMSFVIF